MGLVFNQFYQIALLKLSQLPLSYPTVYTGSVIRGIYERLTIC